MATATNRMEGIELGALTILDSNGDSRITWNRHNPDEVESAREHFRKLRAKHYLGFRMNRAGDKGAQLDEFDANAEEILMVPRSVGG